MSSELGTFSTGWVLLFLQGACSGLIPYSITHIRRSLYPGRYPGLSGRLPLQGAAIFHLKGGRNEI